MAVDRFRRETGLSVPGCLPRGRTVFLDELEALGEKKGSDGIGARLRRPLSYPSPGPQQEGEEC
jgi:hypothetical protein